MYRYVAFAVLAVHLCLVAGGRREPCAQPGALRCDGDHQSVCLARSGVWLRARDCAAAGGACVDGRCAPSARGPAARAEPCEYGGDELLKCSDDCTTVLICIKTNVWTTLKQCSDPTPTCDKATNQCKATSAAECDVTGTCDWSGKLPDLTNSSYFYECSQNNKKNRGKCEEDDSYFNACTEECDYDYDPTERYDDCVTEDTGFSNFVFSNPALYYICVNGEPVWNRCEKGYFEPSVGECIGNSVYCTETC